MDLNLAQLAAAGESNAGAVSRINEDNFIIFSPAGGSAVLAAVADGIGGHSMGEVASGICCRELLSAAMRTDSAGWDREFLLSAIARANARIFDLNYRGKRACPMGCTVIAAVFFRDRLLFAGAGDSRLYQFDRSGGGAPLRQLSTDHRPEGDAEWTCSGPCKRVSLVTRSIGTLKSPEIDFMELPRPPEAVYMLCSDGLYKHQPDLIFAGVLGSGETPRRMTGKLLRNAMLSGERDNVTVICAAPAHRGKEAL